MLERIRLPNLGARADFEEERRAWEALVATMGITYATRNIETHPSDCKCGAATCARLLSVRRYVVAHKRAHAVRRSHSRLQSNLDEYIADENDAEIDLAHDQALLVEEDRQFKKESQDEPR